MKQLFVCHTQYDLIMSVALKKRYYETDNNELILFADFAMIAEMEKQLKKLFSRTLVLPGEHSQNDQRYINKVRTLPRSIARIKHFLNGSYDRLFWKCDYSWPEIWLNKRLHKTNKELKVCWLEDGAYFIIGSPIVNLKNNSIKTAIRTGIGKLLFGRYYSFNGVGIGTSTWNNYFCFTYPKAVRDRYVGTKYLEVDDEAFQYGMMALYQNIIVDLDEGSILLIIDKLDRYKSIEKVTSIIERIAEICKSRGTSLYYKYHPREDRRIDILENKCKAIEQSLGAEALYTANIGKKVKVVGIASTSLHTAKKCGFDVYSLANITGESSSEINLFYYRIGVHIINSPEQIFEN